MLKIKMATIYMVFCIAVGMLAKSRGRGGIRWALIAFFITPLLAGGLVILMRDQNQYAERGPIFP